MKKKYEITTIEQLINICNSKNIENLMTDLTLFLDYKNKVIDKIKESNPELKDKKSSEIMKPIFIWIDDNKNTLDGVQIKNLDTGEITYIKNKKK